MTGIVDTTGAKSGQIGTISLVAGDVTLTGTQTLTNKTLTTPAIPGHIIKVNAFHDDTTVIISANATGAEILDIDFTAQKTNSAYYFSAAIWSCGDSSTGTSDNADIGFTSWLEDSGAGDKYRFGYRKTSSLRVNTMCAANDYYQLMDTDGGTMWGSEWNGNLYSWSWVSGNQASYESTTVVNSAFTAGETVTLKVWLGSMDGRNYNMSNSNASNTNTTPKSHFSIVEVAT